MIFIGDDLFENVVFEFLGRHEPDVSEAISNRFRRVHHLQA